MLKHSLSTSFWFVLLTISPITGTYYINEPGDLILGGLFPIHVRGKSENDCGEFQTVPGYHHLLAMLFAIDRINKDPTLLPNVTLGARVYDTCHSQTIGAKMTKELITITLKPPKNGEQLVGVIGPQSSDLTKVVADFLRVFTIPQVSYGATASLLSDKSIYSYFFRTVPPDTWQAQAMVDVLLELKWRYVITIHSHGVYGEKGMEEFVSVAKKNDICVAKSHDLNAFVVDRDLDEIVRTINMEDEARVIVIFAVEEDIVAMLRAFKRNPPTKKFYWLASDAWGKNLNILKGVEDVAEGAITISHLDAEVPGFVEFLKNRSVDHLSNNTWSKAFWEAHFNCSFLANSTGRALCTGNESLASSHVDLIPVRSVVNAVYSMAHALHNYLTDNCSFSASGNFCRNALPVKREKLVGYLQNVTFQDRSTGERLFFNKKQETRGEYSIFNFQRSSGARGYAYQEVGLWIGPKTASDQGTLKLNVTELVWAAEKTANNTIPTSICSLPCPLGFIRKILANKDCCWLCSECGAEDMIENDTCIACPYGHIPAESLRYCVKLPFLDVIVQSSSIGIVAVSTVGFVGVVVVAVVFFKRANDPLVKASSRELSGIILLGLVMLFVSPTLLLVRPNDAICISQPFVIGLALASCYAPLFMKILRIYRIFASAQRSAGKPMLVSSRSQILITVALIAIQLLFSGISFIPMPPTTVERELSNGDYLLLECSVEKNVFASLLSYNMLLMMLCTLVAFKTRSFPRNFNEAKYIGFTMYFTCFVWIIFFPSYLSAANGLQRINWEAGALLCIGWITLVGLFGPKMYLLFLGNRLSVTDQLAVTNNTISQAAVVPFSGTGLTNQGTSAEIRGQRRKTSSVEEESTHRKDSSN